MTILHAVILGVVQGLTEFLPVSSTAHLIMFPWLLNWPDPGHTFDVALHIGTLLAVIVYFWEDWTAMLTRNRDQLLLVVIGCVPAGIAGLLLDKRVEYLARPQEFAYAPLIIAFFLFTAGIWLYWMDKTGSKRRETGAMKIKDAVIIGIGQAVALLPGVSRSGATIGSGLFVGLTRESAARFSFLLSAPITAAAIALKMAKLLKQGVPPGEGSLMIWGIVASGVSGYLAIRFLMKWVRTRPYDSFVVYRVALAALIVAIWIFRR